MKKSIAFLSLAFFSFISLALASTKVWNGSGDGINWGDGGNWVGGRAPVSGDSVSFSGVTAQSVNNISGLSVAEIVCDGSSTVSVGGNTLTVSSGKINVGENSSLTFAADVKGVSRTLPLVKTGKGVLRFDGQCYDFNCFNAEAGETQFSKQGGDYVKVQPTVTIFDGATITWAGKNLFQNSTVFDVKKGGLLNTERYSDRIGGITGEGRVTGSGNLEVTLPSGPYYVNNNFDNDVNVITLTVDQTLSNNGTAENSKMIFGTEFGCSNVVFNVNIKDGFAFPLEFVAGLEKFSANRIQFQNAYDFEPKNADGDPVELINTSIRARVESAINYENVSGSSFYALSKGSKMTVTGGVATDSVFYAYEDGSVLEYTGGTAMDSSFIVANTNASVVFSGGETTNCFWQISSTSSDKQQFITVTGGDHYVTNVFNAMHNRCIRQTGGRIVFAKGVICHVGGNVKQNSALMPLVVEGGTLIVHSREDAGYANQGTGLDASGDAKVYMDHIGGNNNIIRISSDGRSHIFRIRDNAEVNMLTGLRMICNGSDDGCATGTVDLAGGTLNLNCVISDPGGNEKYPTFFLFNGGLLSFPSEGPYGISHPHAAHHHIYVGESPARIFVDTPSKTDRTISFATPFESNPENTGVDGGLIKDGDGTLRLNAPATIAGPVEIRSGVLRTAAAGGNVLGTGSIFLDGSLLWLDNYSGTMNFAAGAGSGFSYKDASTIYMPTTTEGGTYVFGASDATGGVWSPADDKSFLIIRNGTQGDGIGSSFKIKVNGGVACTDGVIDQPVFSSMGDNDNSVGLYSFLTYDDEVGLKPAAMTSFAEAGATDLADVTVTTTLDADKQVKGLRLHKADLTVPSGVTLKVGDGVKPASVIMNSSSSSAIGIFGDGTIDFGTSRGFVIQNYCKESTNDFLTASIAGTGGIVLGGTPEYYSSICLTGANSYSGGTWISGTRVIPANTTAFGSSRDVYVTGNGIYGGQIYLASIANSNLDYDLHLEGCGLYRSTRGTGAIHAEKNSTISGSVEFMDDTRIHVSDHIITLTLSGVVFGDGTLEKVGTGMIKISGQNPAWSGGAKISAGMLRVVAQDGLGSGDVEVAEGATLRFENDSPITVANKLTGSGTIVLKGAKVTFSDADEFEGTIEVNSGAELGVDGTVSADKIVGDGTVSGTGSLVVDVPEGESVLFDGTLNGDFSIVKTGEGTLVLTGANAYTGSTSILGGKVILDETEYFSDVMASAVVHLDASKPETLTIDADGCVSEWRDADGRDLAFTNSAVELQPVYVENVINGMSALRFEKGLAHLTSTEILDNRTVIIVHRTKSGSRPSGMSESWDCAGIYGINRDDKGIRFETNQKWKWDGFVTKHLEIRSNRKVYDTPGEAATFKYNNFIVSSVTLSELRNNNRSAIGDYWHHTTHKRSYYGDIAEIIVFDKVLTDSDLRFITDMLIDKWDIFDEDEDPLNALLADSVVHLDATNEDTLELDENGNVSSWRDVHWRNVSFSNTVAEERPGYVSDAINGLPALRFDAVYQHLESNVAVANQTVIIVHRNKSGSRPSDMHSSWGYAGIYGWHGRDAGIRFSGSTTFSNDGWKRTLSVRVNGEATNKLTADETAVSTVAMSSVASGDYTAIGDYWNDLSGSQRIYEYKRSYYGDIAEIIVFPRALTADEIALLEDFLMTKWGVIEDVAEEEEIVSPMPQGGEFEIASGATLDLSGYSLEVETLNGAGDIINSSEDAAVFTLLGGGAFAGVFGSNVELFLAGGAQLEVADTVIAETVSGSGVITEGTMTITKSIRPGGENAAGTLTFEKAPVVSGAELEIDFIAGEGDKLVVNDAFDISSLKMDVKTFEGFTEEKYCVLSAESGSGAFLDDGLSASEGRKWYILYHGDEVWIAYRRGLMLFIK